MLSKREIKKIIEECKKEVNSAEGYTALIFIQESVQKLEKEKVEGFVIGLTKFSVSYLAKLANKEMTKKKK